MSASKNLEPFLVAMCKFGLPNSTPLATGACTTRKAGRRFLFLDLSFPFLYNFLKLSPTLIVCSLQQEPSLNL